MGRLKSPPPRLKPVSDRLSPPPKQTDPFYGTADWKAAREAAGERAGWRCEVVEGGARCRRCRRAGDRMFIDHIVERRDGGPDLDPQNLRCLCSSHHVGKTAAARNERMR